MRKLSFMTFLALTTMLSPQLSNSQEVAVISNNDSNDALPIAQLKNLVNALGASFTNLQSEFTVVKGELVATQDKLTIVEREVERSTACNNKHMIYAPTSSDADAGGCISPAPSNVVVNQSCTQEGMVVKGTASNDLLTCIGGKWVSSSSIDSMRDLLKMHAGKSVSCRAKEVGQYNKTYQIKRARILDDGTPQFYVPTRAGSVGYRSPHKWVSALNYSSAIPQTGGSATGGYHYTMSLKGFTYSYSSSRKHKTDNISVNIGCSVLWPLT